MEWGKAIIILGKKIRSTGLERAIGAPTRMT
jgi:hypothetical protein